MKSTTITQKGQVTIPVDIRQKLDIHAGDKVEFRLRRDEVIISKQKDDITAAFGMIKVNKKVTLKDIQSAIEEGPDDDIS